jgi:hypothetical protein
MAETYEWRHYADGDTPGAFASTIFLNDGSINDNITTAGGITNPLGVDQDWAPPDSNPFVHWYEIVLFGDPHILSSSVTFHIMASGTHGQVLVITWDIYGVDIDGNESIIGSGSGTGLTQTTDVVDGAYQSIRLLYRFERVDTGSGPEVVPALSFTDFRYVLFVPPVAIEVCPIMWRKRTRGAPISDAWGPYFCTDTLQDFALGDQSTAANGTAAADISYAFTAPDEVYIDVEALMIIDPVAAIQDISFTTQTAWSLVGTSVPDGTYALDIRVDGLWISIGEGSLTMNVFGSFHFPIDPLLFVERVRLTVTTHGNLI